MNGKKPSGSRTGCRRFSDARNGKEKLEETRSKIVAGWYAPAQLFQEERKYGLADEVRFFVARMSPPQTDQEQLAEKIRNQSRAREVKPLDRTR